MAELSGLEVLVLAKEVDSLRGFYVNNIYSVGRSQIFRLRSPSGDRWLVASPTSGLWVSEKVSEREETAEFTSKLRKELLRTKLKSASQADLDRVYILDFEGDQPRRLILELMPPGNIVVTDAEEKVVLALDEVRSQTRRVTRGMRYSPPAQRRLSPATLTPQDVVEILQEEKTVGRAVGRHVALPRKYVAEVLRRLGVSDGAPAEALAGKEKEVAGVVRSLVEEASTNPKPCVCSTDDGEEVYAVAPSGLQVLRTSESLSELCDSLFLPLEATPKQDSKEDSKRKELEVTIVRLKADEESLLESAKSTKELAGKARSASMEDALQLLARAGLSPRSPPASPSAAASLIYDKAKDAESKAANARSAADDLRKKLGKSSKSPTPRVKRLPTRKQDWYEKFRWFFTTEGKLAVGGRDSQSNTILIRRHAETGDTVYHADLFGSPFFVLKDGAAQSEAETKEVAQATVAFSSAWKTGLGAADAYWVTPDQVSTAAPSGEYLARGSFAIKGKKNYVTKNLVEISVGVEETGRVVSGPEPAVRKASPRYLVLRPHHEKVSDTAKKIQAELSKGATVPTLDDIVRALPSGGGKVVRKVGEAPP
jgi:predicted ribosome quality control (RQC) complex YloA/Tae2 family protein